MDESDARFRREILPHLDAAYNLARWIVGREADDIVQEAALRAYKSFHGWHGEHARAWLLAIVRNCCFTYQRSDRRQSGTVPFNEATQTAASEDDDPAAVVMHRSECAALHAAIAALPIEFREMIVLREFEQMDYRQIASIVGVPVGTVMSRLSRARERLREALNPEAEAD